MYSQLRRLWPQQISNVLILILVYHVRKVTLDFPWHLQVHIFPTAEASL